MPRLAGAENRETTRLIMSATVILQQEWPMTLRQLFYRLVSRAVIENSLRNYQRVSRAMTRAREDERCRFDWIVDRSRPLYEPNVWDDAKAYFRAVQRGYRRDYWAHQPNHVELWVEKDSIVGSILPITDRLGVAVRVGRGFLSTTRKHEIAETFAAIQKLIFVFYLGDHDPSGHAIEHEAVSTIRDYMLKLGALPRFTCKRLAIHAEDIERFNLPPLRVKSTDSRASEFRTMHGNSCVELDALPPNELRRRIQTAVYDLIDHEKWNRAVAVEKAERQSILSFAAKLHG